MQCYTLTIFCPHFDFIEELRTANRDDPELLAIRQMFLDQNMANIILSFEGNLLYLKHHLVIPSQGSLKQKLLIEFHDSVQGGHAGSTTPFIGLLQIFIGRICALMCTLLSQSA